MKAFLIGMLLCLSTATAAEFDDVIKSHPAGETLARIFTGKVAPPPADFAATGLTKKDYLKLVAGNVDFWRKHLSKDGAILDFYEADKEHPDGQEKQYSTPAFALAASELVKVAGRDDLLEPATRAFSFALTALVNKTTANWHADFYIPMLMHAHRILEPRVSKELAAKWREQLEAIVPDKNYRDVGGNGNWNLVNVSGEALRRKDKLVATTQMSAQQSYLDKMLARQAEKHFSKFGMYEDATWPLAYDAFPRLWLEDMTAEAAYDGPARASIENLLSLGSFSTLLLFSPQGEWVCGGRSAHHQWNEAECAVIGEVNAARWKARGRDDIAGAFKRMARMGLKSVMRWQRPSGELWIVKNFAEPDRRFGYEGYSFNSQYNLLPMAMLCIAYERADETVAEKPLPAEYSTYVFDVHEPFTQIVAASGGYYIQINTNADPHYNATGLQRVHRRGVELSPLTDSAAAERVTGAKADDPKAALAPGVQWKAADGSWIGLADFRRYEAPPKPTSKPKPGDKPVDEKPQRTVKNVKVGSTISGDAAVVSITYELAGPDAKTEQQQFQVTPDGVICEQRSTDEGRRLVVPVLVNDGRKDSKVTASDHDLLVDREGGKMRIRVLNPLLTFSLSGPRVPTHNGYVQAAVAENVGTITRWAITLGK